MSEQEIEIAKRRLTELSIAEFGSVQGWYSTAIQALNAFSHVASGREELLEALEAMTELFEMTDEANDPSTDSFPVLIVAREAIKKARGEQ